MARTSEKATLMWANISTDIGIDSPKRTLVLTIGEAGDWAYYGPNLPFDSQIGFVNYADLSKELIITLCPDVVITPLLSTSFDCLDVARILGAVEYRGSLTVVSPEIPKPRMITKELRALCPGVQVVIDAGGPTPPLRPH